MAPPDGLHLPQCMASLGEEYVICVDACLALFRLLWHSSGAVCRVVKHCSWFAEEPKRNVTSFVEEGKMQVLVRVKGWMVKHLFIGSM